MVYLVFCTYTIDFLGDCKVKDIRKYSGYIPGKADGGIQNASKCEKRTNVL